MSAASGIGSWPGTDARAAVGVVREILTGAEIEPDLPYLPELPARGPGADLVGRTAGLLTELPVDLQPSGWRLVDRPGRDAERTRSWLRHDLDELAEAYDGYSGPLKLQVAGPWTLAAELRVSRGERVVVDAGACRDVVASLADGLVAHVRTVNRLVPGARIVVQLDEPSLPSVLAGRLPTSSGYGAHRAIEAQTVRSGLSDVVTAARAVAESVTVHCCAPDVPVRLLREAGADAVALDTTLLGRADWESLAQEVEAGLGLWAGVDVTRSAPDAPTASLVSGLVTAWTGVGLPRRDLRDVLLTPTCGLAGSSPDGARRVQRRVRDAARALAEVADG